MKFREKCIPNNAGLFKNKLFSYGRTSLNLKKIEKEMTFTGYIETKRKTLKKEREGIFEEMFKV